MLACYERGTYWQQHKEAEAGFSFNLFIKILSHFLPVGFSS